MYDLLCICSYIMWIFCKMCYTEVSFRFCSQGETCKTERPLLYILTVLKPTFKYYLFMKAKEGYSLMFFFLHLDHIRPGPGQKSLHLNLLNLTLYQRSYILLKSHFQICETFILFKAKMEDFTAFFSHLGHNRPSRIKFLKRTSLTTLKLYYLTTMLCL